MRIKENPRMLGPGGERGRRVGNVVQRVPDDRYIMPLPPRPFRAP